MEADYKEDKKRWRIRIEKKYEQIADSIKDLIISGALKEDDMLPSIRSLAKENNTSVITTIRAYNELKQKGYIYSVPGKGCFVSKLNTLNLREELLKKLDQLIILSKTYGIKKEEIIELLKKAENCHDENYFDRNNSDQ